MADPPSAAYTAASAALDKLSIKKTAGHFADRYNQVSVFEVSRGGNDFAAFVYMCRLNLDLDGAPTTYGFNNPGRKGQQHLDPLESWHKGKTTTETSQKVGLGNACGDPGDGTKGWQNFLAGNRNFYWAGLKALSLAENISLGLILDTRDELEAGLKGHAKNGKPVLKPKGQGYYPVVQPDTGYYISGTSVTLDGVTGPGAAYNQNSYLDSTVVPYAVWANNWAKLSIGGKRVQQGDFGLAIENATGANLGYVYGDSGTVNKVGEVSQKMHKTLGRGAGLVTFIAFPGSGWYKKVPADPALVIPVRVLMNTVKLYPHADELAAHLAMGPELQAPKKTAEMSPGQAQLFQNFKSALSAWTISG